VWNTLITRQLKVIEGRACQEYLDGIEKLGLPHDRIPQLGEINKVLGATTGWQVARVPALIPFQTFFELLASKQFPVATFIRTREELDYLQEPDIFHEIFGHCPLLTNPWFAEFTHTYGKLGLQATKEERVYLARLYWMTIEFGLLETPQGRRIYGGGILSSPKETVYSLSGEPEHQAFDPLEPCARRTASTSCSRCISSCQISSACSTWPTKTSWAWSSKRCRWACTHRNFRQNQKPRDPQLLEPSEPVRPTLCFSVTT
jgi:phenylalanine-4-hydroxylase